MKKYFKIATSATLFALVLTASLSPSSAFAVSKQWTGAGDATNWSDVLNWGDGIVPVTGDDLNFTTGSAQLDITNDISGLKLSSLTINGAGTESVVLGGNSFRINGNINDSNTGDAVNYIFNNIATDGATLRVYATQKALIAFGGTFYMYDKNLGLRSYDDAQIVVAGDVVGTGNVVVAGDGTGGTYFGAGANIVRPIEIKEGGYLSGSANTGSINVTSTGYYAPDNCMNVKNFKVDGYMYARIGGTSSCSGYGRTNATGTVDVAGGTLATRYSLESSYTPARGSKYILIANDGSDKVIGSFASRPEGAKFNIGTYSFQITYKGGSGNDVVLTRL